MIQRMIDVNRIKTKVKEILNQESDKETILLHISLMLKQEVYHYDWVGFYLLSQDENGLVLGPYTGTKTEHTCIPLGKGVCGQVAINKTAMVVQDVSKIENYLSCSINVISEIVVPVLKSGKFVAELDIDSHSPAPFSDIDIQLLEYICSEISFLFDE